MSLLSDMDLPEIEFRECSCTGHQHKVLFENGVVYHYGFPAYTKRWLLELLNRYLGEGLLGDDEIRTYRDWFSCTNQTEGLPEKLPETLQGMLLVCIQTRNTAE